MSDVRDMVYELFMAGGWVFGAACTTLLGAMCGTTSRYVRWVYVYIISIVMPPMPEVSVKSAAVTAGAALWTAWQKFGNSTWVGERVYDHFKPVNKNLAHEQAVVADMYKVIYDIANWFEYYFPGSGIWISTFLFFIANFKQIKKTIYGERVVVVETAVAPPPKKTARGKSPARKSTRTRK